MNKSTIFAIILGIVLGYICKSFGYNLNDYQFWLIVICGSILGNGIYDISKDN